MVHCEPIGTVVRPATTPAELPRQGHEGELRGRIEIRAEFRDGLAGYRDDRVVIVWFAHLADRSVTAVDRGPGVFASRSQDRPNPLCLTTCDVIAVTETGLEVVGLDAVDGTPVLDLKPPLRHEGS